MWLRWAVEGVVVDEATILDVECNKCPVQAVINGDKGLHY
jgi:hypothetical protein